MLKSYRLSEPDLLRYELGLRGIDEGFRVRLAQMLSDAADKGVEGMQAQVPKGETLVLFGSIGKEQTPRWSPGGAGGAGFWEVKFGPGVGPRPAPFYTRWVTEGTGIYGEHGGEIFAHAPSMVLKWTGARGETVFRWNTDGQKPQRRWIDYGRQVARTHIRREVWDMRNSWPAHISSR